MDGAKNVIQVFQMYNGDTWLFALFLAAAAFLFLRKGGAYRFHAALTSLAACLFLFNQAAFWLFEKVLGGAETYYRFLWMIPVVPLLSYVAVDLIAMRRKNYQKVLAAAALFLVVVFAGTPYLDAQSVQKPSNVHYLNTDAVEVCRLINEDRQSAYPDQDVVKVASPMELMMSLRLQEPDFRNAIVRSVYMYKGEKYSKSKPVKRQQILLNLVNGKKVTASWIKIVLKKARVQYVVIGNQYDQEKYMTKAGCTVVGRMERYTIYRAPA